jgi:hypothetical protein
MSTIHDCGAGKEITDSLGSAMPWFAQAVVKPGYGLTGTEGNEPSYMEVTITLANGSDKTLSQKQKTEIREVMLSKELNEQLSDICDRFFGWKLIRIRTTQRVSFEKENYVWLIEKSHKVPKVK